MRTLCAWCGKVIKDGPEKTVSHGICEDCIIQVDEPKWKKHEPPPEYFCEMVAWWMKSLLIGSILFNLVFWILFLAAKALGSLGTICLKAFPF
jgi:hypothetical protein